MFTFFDILTALTPSSRVPYYYKTHIAITCFPPVKNSLGVRPNKPVTRSIHHPKS